VVAAHAVDSDFDRHCSGYGLRIGAGGKPVRIASAQQKSGNDLAAFLSLTYRHARARRNVTPNEAISRSWS
jgi:hypothetical protein